jgi:hypothetical protein
MEGGGPGDDDPHYDPSIIKPHLPLVQPRTYKGERKDNACEQWCMDMHNFMRRFEILTGKYLRLVQAVEYISQYFTDAALTWWSNLIFNIQHSITRVQKPTIEHELFSLL